ncbi:MAG: hypothetical protein KAS39_03240, partial [Actinomycetia bacterium]|nr:hypothetical protein [Actinomycetes bacterium]
MKNSKKKDSSAQKSVIDLYIAENIIKESITAELLVIKILTYVVPFSILFSLGYFLFFLITTGTPQWFYFLLFFYLFCVMIYHRIVKKIFENGSRSFILRFIDVAIEISTISIVMIVLYKTLNAEIILTGPLVMVYMIMIIFTGFRYSLRLSLFAGIISAVQHFIIYLVLVRDIE